MKLFVFGFSSTEPMLQRNWIKQFSEISRQEACERKFFCGPFYCCSVLERNKNYIQTNISLPACRTPPSRQWRRASRLTPTGPTRTTTTWPTAGARRGSWWTWARPPRPAPPRTAGPAPQTPPAAMLYFNANPLSEVYCIVWLNPWIIQRHNI